jgi:penicillin-binding protein 1A
MSVYFLKRWSLRLLRASLVLGLLLLVSGGITAGIIYWNLTRDLPKISTLHDYRPPVITTVYADDGRVIGEFFKERRIVVPLSRIPETLLQAFVAAEDSRFYQHQGVDILSIIRAFFKNLEAGTIVQGGSTITQQVTRSFFLTPERNYTRKIREAILAYRLERTFSKEDILFLYLNQIYLGHGAYGVEAAAQNYFGKHVEQLTLAECALLGGLPQAPSRYSPFHHPERAKKRQIYVLKRMVEEQYITSEQAEDSMHHALDIQPRRNLYMNQVPYYTEHVRRYVEDVYGREALYHDGLKVFTAVNVDMQKVAQEEVDKGLRALDKRQGYRGPVDQVAEDAISAYLESHRFDFGPESFVKGNIVRGLVTRVDRRGKTVTVRMGDIKGMITLEDMKWARSPDPKVPYWAVSIRHPEKVLSPGDVIDVRLKRFQADGGYWELALEQAPRVQAALLCMENKTGHVKVMLGGRDFRQSQFNRALQSRRQPGSAFKPVIYAAALDKGYTPASIIMDSPLIYRDTKRNFIWKPKNYEGEFNGPIRLRTALTKSMNVVTIKLLKNIGIDYTIDYARRLGIEAPIAHNLSIALGSSGISLLEMVNAYAVFANQGQRLKPVFVTRVEDRNGHVLEKHVQRPQKVMDERTAYLVTSLLESVVNEGTGRRVKALKRPVAGKTGTTNNLFDAWFMGYTPDVVTGTWVGFDQEASMGKGETGSRAAIPIWMGFMQRILTDSPVHDFQAPEGVVFARIDSETGLLPIPESADVIFECFKEGTVPTEHTRSKSTVADSEDFYKLEL